MIATTAAVIALFTQLNETAQTKEKQSKIRKRRISDVNFSDPNV